MLLPILVVVVLNVPSLGLGYFWDDFYFLTFKGTGDVFANLVPNPHAEFYRPIPLGIYFKLLRFLDPASGVLGHFLNLTALCGIVVLLMALASRLSGPRAGLFAALIFASYGQVPGLVAWVSCSQDLFAILFATAAFLFRHQGRNVAALLCAAAGLLSKETAVAAFPVLMFWDRLVGRTAVRRRFQLLGYAAVALLWVLIHPGIQQLAVSGFKSDSTGYVGLEHSERWGRYLLRYLLALVNLPPPGFVASWWEARAPWAFSALAILVVGLLILDQRRKTPGPAGSIPLGRVGWISASFILPSLLMPTLLVRHWSPYFACLPALGAAMFLGPALARRHRLIALIALSMFLLFGAWSRGVRAEREWILSEPVMVESAEAVQEVRANFQRLFPTFPKGSQVVTSIVTRGSRGIRSALIDGQALSLWYQDPTLRTVVTMQRRPSASAEYLVRVTNDLDLIAIDPDTQGIRTTMRTSPGLSEIDPPIVSYARAVAAAGDTNRGVRILEGLSRMESGELIDYNRRLMGSMLLAVGRRSEADSILGAAALFPEDFARALVLRLLSEASPSESLDLAAFEAFGLSAADPASIRWVMRQLSKEGSLAQAAWYAQRLGDLVPGDAESAVLIEKATRLGIQPRREGGWRLEARETVR